MPKKIIIESFRNIRRWEIEDFVRKGVPVFVIESFAGLHKNRGPIPGFPYAHPAYAEEFIKAGKVQLLPVDLLDEKTFYCYAADKAVEVVEAVARRYQELNTGFIRLLTETLKEKGAADAFKKDLCRELASFYSQNILLSRLDQYFGGDTLTVYPEMNTEYFLQLKSLLEQSSQPVFPQPHIEFAERVRHIDAREELRFSLFVFLRLFAQTAACLILGRKGRTSKTRKEFVCGVTVMSPRQLRWNQRGPDFFVDDKVIHSRDVVCFPLLKMTPELSERLQGLPITVHPVPPKGRFFSNGREWFKLLKLAIATNPLKNGREVHVASITFFQYFRWLSVLGEISIRHFVTHVDFDVGHIGRNIALKQNGVETWYLTDSMNLGCVYWGRKDGCLMRHPLWTYLQYDHCVTWTDLIRKYYLAHPTGFKTVHVVGCLWSQQVHSQKENSPEILAIRKIKSDGKFVIVAFDTTYSLKGFATYEEGLAFTRHLLKLLETNPETHLVLKEKKSRDIHAHIHPVDAPKLLALYDSMKENPRVSLFSNEADSAALISVADMVISFPFTSSTFEAISCGKPAIWHDPMGFCRDTVYGREGGFVTHGLEELIAKFSDIKRKSAGKGLISQTYQIPEAMDPFNDGKAIDRFRELLAH